MQERSSRTETPAVPRGTARSLHLGGGAVAALLLLLGVHAGCNSITGANDFIIDEDVDGDGDGDGDGDPGGPGGPSGGDPTGQASGATTGSPGGVGAGGGAAASTGGQPETLGSAPGVSVAEVSIYQAVKRTIMQNGSPVGNGVPIIAGRDALVRVFMATDGGYDGGPVVVRLHLGDGPPLEVTQSVGGGNEQSLGSTVNFQVPGGSLPAGVSWQVEVGRAGGAGAPYAYPAGQESLGAQSVGQTLKVVLVPVSYGADGSNRLPDTSAGQVEAYRKRFWSMYPAPQVDVSVHAAVGWNNNVSAGGNGWGSLLEAIAGLRENDNAPNDAYYYGIFAPAQSFGQYCGGGCTAGLGYIGGPNDAYTRTAIGLGFSGEEATDTAVHEIGHTHGREHAPCQVSGDGNYPHPNGQIGVWGYDMTSQQLIQPQIADFMGYCFPIWISDYTYDAIATRMKFVNGAKQVVPQDQMNLIYERVSIGGDGQATWQEPTTIREPPKGQAVPVSLDTAAGPEDATGAFFPYDHLPGGTLFVRRGAMPATALVAEVGGQVFSLAR